MTAKIASLCGCLCLILALLTFRHQPVVGAFMLLGAAFTGLYAGLAK